VQKIRKGVVEKKMRVYFWNIRGLGGGRRRQLKELIYKYRIDVICLQETMKTHFSVIELRNLDGDKTFPRIGLM
jgi:exonuclease III